MSDRIRTKKGLAWFEDGITYLKIDDGAEITIEDGPESTAAFKRLSKVPVPVLVDFGKIRSQSREVRNYWSRDPGHLSTYTAVAIIVSNPLARVIANFFLGLNKALRPTRLFNTVEEGRAWLQQFKRDPPAR